MSMNIFRLVGDWLHVMAIGIVLHRLLVAQNAQGVSRKTQELYLLVFVTRYLDLFTVYFSMYNSVLKIYFILSTAIMVCLLTRSFGSLLSHPCHETYKAEQDNFPHWKYIVLPSFALSFLVYLLGSGGNHNLMELLWTFSICLEAVATIPQVIVFRTYRQVENLTGGSFFLAMGLYRGCYILNWIYRSYTESYYRHHYLVYIAGGVQVTVVLFGLFWPVSLDSSEADQPIAAAPLLPQLKQFMKMHLSTKTVAFTIGTFLLYICFVSGFQLMPLNVIAAVSFAIGALASKATAESNGESTAKKGEGREEEDVETQAFAFVKRKSTEPLDPLKAPLLEDAQSSIAANNDLVGKTSRDLVQNTSRNVSEDGSNTTTPDAQVEPED